jgi:phosphate:Na+ symporter
MTQYEDGPNLRMLLGAVTTTPILAVILAAGLTWAAHSSVAVVLLIMSLATKGVVPPMTAFALVLGANLGTAINPVIEGTTDADPTGKRLAIGNLLTRVVGVALALLVLDPVSRFMVTVEPHHARAVADFHTLFNLALAVLFLPLLTPYANLLRQWFPKRIDPDDPSRPRYLDTAAKEMPIVALGGAARETLRLADVLAEMLADARKVLVTSDRKLISATRHRDDVLDHLNTAIKTYLTSLDSDELSEADLQRLNEILTFGINMEQAGDVVDRNLLPHVSKCLKRGLVFSKDEQAELTAMMDRLLANLRTAASLFMTQDTRAAHLLADEKVAFREAESEATSAHFARLQSGGQDMVETSGLHLDLLRDMKLINSHIVAAAAYPVLERGGKLLPSRIASAD